MCIKWILISTILFSAIETHVTRFSDHWALRIDGGPETAKKVAEQYGFQYLSPILDDWYYFRMRESIEFYTTFHQLLLRDNRVFEASLLKNKIRRKRDFIEMPRQAILNDEWWPLMWYLNRGKKLDMNVQEAWAEGITGRGVVVTILDDGIEIDHPDLKENYDPQASYDFNDNDENPTPHYDYTNFNRHGTRCAGEVAAAANNSICGVGVAFHAQIGGVRMLDGLVNDAIEAMSLGLNPQHIDIYSASWGPDDNGTLVKGPGKLVKRAFVQGVTMGRGGKGSIFVWATGNGGMYNDNCNCDGYTNSIWTISINSATESGLVPFYSEKCSSTLATTYSSGYKEENQVVTTDLNYQCTSSHTGSSASAPLAAGICALALEANKNLTWRDMQHIVVRTAKTEKLRTLDWVTNGVGRKVSHSFGYGLMDAGAMVRLARKWKTVPEQYICELIASEERQPILPKEQLSLELRVEECRGVKFLEHVQAVVSLTASVRGDIEIYLTSPQGTRSVLLTRKPADSSAGRFIKWPFMSVHNWGERSDGIWKLDIHNTGEQQCDFEEWKMVLYGTETSPEVDDEQDKDKTGQIVISKDVVADKATDMGHNVIDRKGDHSSGSADRSHKRQGGCLVLFCLVSLIIWDSFWTCTRCPKVKRIV